MPTGLTPQLHAPPHPQLPGESCSSSSGGDSIRYTSTSSAQETRARISYRRYTYPRIVILRQASNPSPLPKHLDTLKPCLTPHPIRVCVSLQLIFSTLRPCSTTSSTRHNASN